MQLKVKNWKSFIKFALLPTVLATTPLVAISCGISQNSLEKIEQDKKLANKDAITKVAENIWLSNTLANLYSITLDKQESLNDNYKKLFENVEFKADAFKAYNAFVGVMNLKTPGFLARRVNDLLAKGQIDSTPEMQALVTSIGTPILSEAQLEQLYTNEITNVGNEVNKLLLINKYFLINNEDELTKLDASNFNDNKLKYDTKYFNLVGYTLNKKLIQKWGYQATNSDSIFAEIFQIINNVNDYNNFINGKPNADKKVDSVVFFNQKHQFELNIGAYQGIQSIGSLNVPFSYDLLKNVTDYEALSGFYDNQTSKLVSVNPENLSLATPVSVVKSGSTIDINYLNAIAPIAKEKQLVNGKNQDGTEKKETFSVLTFDNTPFANKTLELGAVLYNDDQALYQNAQNAFVRLGYTLELGKNTELNNALKSLGFVKES